MEWIRFKDVEPEKNGNPFLCWNIYEDDFPKVCIRITHVDKQTGVSTEGYYETAGGSCCFYWEPTHWMPLPLPPKNSD